MSSRPRAARRLSFKAPRYRGNRVERVRFEGDGVARPTPRTRLITAYQDPFPMRLKARLKYSGTMVLNGSAGSCATWAFAANGLYDPDITGSGHQPMYYDQLSAIYGRATVTGATIKITPIGTQLAPEGTILGVFLDNDNATSSSLTQNVERAGSKYMSVGDWAVPNKALVFRYDAVKFHGKAIMGDNNLETYPGSNPSNVDYFKIFNGSPNPLVNPGDVSCLVEIWYDAVFHDRVETGES